MSLLLDDIKEELRREDFIQKFKKLLPWILTSIALVLIATAAYSIQKNRQEKYLIEYEALYAQALEHMEKENWAFAKTELEKVAKECPGLKFLALCTLSKIPQDQLLKKSHALPSFNETRQDLMRCDERLLYSYKNTEFQHFLSLCRLFLDGQLQKGYFGPSPLASVSTSSETGHRLIPLSEKDLSNAFSIYHSSPIWGAIAMAVPIMSMDSNEKRQLGMQEWVKSFQMRFGIYATIPLYALMGTAQEIKK